MFRPIQILRNSAIRLVSLLSRLARGLAGAVGRSFAAAGRSLGLARSTYYLDPSVAQGMNSERERRRMAEASDESEAPTLEAASTETPSAAGSAGTERRRPDSEDMDYFRRLAQETRDS